MNRKYVIIDLTTKNGYDEADRLKNLGWKVIRNGIFTITMVNK